MSRKQAHDDQPTHSAVIHLHGAPDFPVVVKGSKEFFETILEKWTYHFHAIIDRVEITTPKTEEPKDGE